MQILTLFQEYLTPTTTFE
uniref:Uncharacterized protein n=1 Tax=Arundo donax TaxID=35708 RepID=A0A0A8YRA1_ARUDO